MTLRRYLKAAVSIDEYHAICIRADAEGITMAGYIRAAVARDVERQTIVEILNHHYASLTLAGNPTSPSTETKLLDNLEPTLLELLQLTRLIAATSNPQTAARVTASINQQYPQRGSK